MEYLVPILVGVMASLLAPMVGAAAQAYAASRASRRDRRRALVDSWRKGIAEAKDFGDGRDEVRSTLWYETLRPYLSAEIRKDVEYGFPPNANVIEVPSPSSGKDLKRVDLRPLRNRLADRVDELAGQWKVD